MILIKKTHKNEIGGFGKEPLKIIRQTYNKFTKNETIIGYVKMENQVEVSLKNVVTAKEIEEINKRLQEVLCYSL